MTVPEQPDDPGATGGSLNASSRAVATNAASGYVTLVLGALLGFVLTPILLRQLGTTGFGVWSLVLATVAYLGLLEAGIGLATITRVAAIEARGPRELSRLVSTSLTLFCGIAALGLVVASGLSLVIPELFGVPPRMAGEARSTLILVGAWQSVSFVMSAYTAALLGTGRMYLVNLSGFAVSAVVTASQAALALAGAGLVALGCAQLAGGVVSLLVFRRQVRRALPGVVVSVRRADMATARRLVSLGWRNAVSSVASTLAFGSDVVLVGLLLDPAAAAAYAVALRGYTLLHRVTTGGLSAMGPVHAHAAANATNRRRFDLYCLSLAVTLCLAILAGSSVGAFAEPLLELWLGDVPPHAPTVLVLLCIVLVLQSPGTNAYSVLLNSERAGELMRIVVLAAVVNLVASVILTQALGTVGPAVGSLVAVAVFDAVYMPRRVSHMLGASYRELLARVFIPLALPFTVVLATLGLGRVLIDDGPAVLAVQACTAVVFLACLRSTPLGRQLLRLARRRTAVPS